MWPRASGSPATHCAKSPSVRPIKAVGSPANLEGKPVITSAVDDDRLAFFKHCKVNLVIDVSPKLFEHVVGVNVIEAMILAKLGKSPEDVSDDDFIEILDELDLKPHLLHPTGKFRDIRRFATAPGGGDRFRGRLPF